MIREESEKKKYEEDFCRVFSLFDHLIFPQNYWMD